MSATVLVVDDEQDLLFMLRLSLELGGYQVLEAGTGQSALDILDSQRPDAIVLDLRLPDIDGMQILRYLRDDPCLAQIPVVVASAHASVTAEEEARALGCRAYLTKPLSPAHLRSVLDGLLEGLSSG